MKMQRKYKNNKVVFDGITFDSKKEMSRYIELKKHQDFGLIENLTLQKPFVLVPSVVLDGRKKPDIRYVADFYYEMDGQSVVEDVKSAMTKKLSTYRIKKHLMKHVHNIDIKEI